MKNIRGLSTIVTTLILVLLSLVAVAMLWNPVQDLLGRGDETFDQTKCLTVDLRTQVIDSGIPGQYNVTFTRNDGGEESVGVKIVFHNRTGNIVSEPIDFGAYLDTLDTVTMQLSTSPIIYDAGRIDIVPYFLDPDTNVEQLCTLREIRLG